MKNQKIISMAALLLASLTAVQAQFTPGNLVVLRDGTGSGALSSVGAAIFLDQYTTGVSGFVNSLAIPATGSTALVNSGSAGSEGQLSLSADNQYLILAGYNASAGTAGVASSATIPRGIATVDANGNYSLVATTTTFYNGNNIRGGASDGNGNFWGAGAASTGGTVYLGTGTAAQVLGTNSLAIQDIGGNLFFSTAKGTTGIYEISGTPTSGTSAPTLVLANANPSDFSFNANMTIAYVANTGSGANGGISRYNFSGGIWTLAYTLDSSTAMNGLAVDFSGANPIVYATTESGTSLVAITDTGSSSAATVLDTAASNTAFRGLEFAPVPEPSTLALAGLGLTGLIVVFRKRNRKS